jgi:hypothetical protein
MDHVNPFWIPLGAFAVVIVAIVASLMSASYKQRLKVEQRLAMLARGMSAGEIERLLAADAKITKDPLQGLAFARRTAIVLISTGLGLIFFFLILAWIVDNHHVLAGGAAGVIPLTIGLGFLIDYGLQKREMARFSLDVGRAD